ncbi:MAG: cyclic nucleotide-binding domain-containing protein [Alphaproteobacteria bacterium]
MSMQDQTLAPGTLIYEEGQPSDAVYFIRSGKVELFKRAGGRRIRLVTLGKGQVLGETSVIRDEPHSTTALAISETSLMVLSKDDFLAAFGGKDHIALKILRMLCERLARVDQQMADEAEAEDEAEAHIPMADVASIKIIGNSEIVRWQIGKEALPIHTTPFHVGCHRQGDGSPALRKSGLSLLVTDDHQLSPHHFAIDERDGVLTVHDLGSHLGTMVNGRRISRFDPEQTAALRLGSNEIVAGGAESPYRFIIEVTAKASAAA